MLFPEAEFRPPVAAGEVLTWGLRAGDVLVLLDGLFLQSRAVRHKELLHLLDAGVTVVGASSMGALRAAELDVHGMVGVGRVYRAYRDGVVVGDDEVALMHTDGETGHRAVAWALVDLRYALERAVEAGDIGAGDAPVVLRCAAELPFTARDHATVLRAALAAGADRDAVGRLRDRYRPDAGWAKLLDARRALAVARRLFSRPPLPAADAGNRTPIARTTYLHLWSGGRTPYASAVHRAVMDPAFPDHYRRIAAECLLLAAHGVDAGGHVAAERAALGIAPAADGLLPWDGLVTALHPLLPGVGLPGDPSDTTPGMLALLRPAEREPGPEMSVLLATRLWRGDPQYDWTTPLVARLPAGPGPAPAAPDAGPAEARATVLGILRDWGVRRQDEVLPTVRAHGLLDAAELVRAVRAGLVPRTEPRAAAGAGGGAAA